MTENQIKVRRKETPPANRKKLYFLTGSAILIMLGIVVTIVVSKFSPKLSAVEEAVTESAADGSRQIIRVPAGGNLQTAINRANGGDIIELQAGATYVGEIKLPKKALNDFITIQSSAVRQLPENVRVSPAQSKLMAKIVTKGAGKPALSTERGANYFRFIGIEFAPDTKDYTYNLIYLAADDSDKIADVPHHLEFDRCFVHSSAQAVTRRGLALNSAQTVVKNSYFQGFAYEGEETQGICGWTGTKNVKILNNYIEGGAENVMFGGSDPASAELSPTDIEVRGNHLNKPAAWKGKVSMKTLFELKNAAKVQFTDNYLENNWVGSAFRITVRNQDGKAPFSTVEDVEMRNNIINGAGEGVNILGKDNNFPSRTLNRMNIVNNLFLNIGGGEFGDGSGYFFQISDGQNILIAHNTAFNHGNIATFYGEMPKNFVMRDNITGHGSYGIHGFDNLDSPAAKKVFGNNVFINNRSVSAGDLAYPSNNFAADNEKAVGFTNAAQNNFTLAANSKYKGKATDKTDLGCDSSKLNQALSSKSNN